MSQNQHKIIISNAILDLHEKENHEDMFVVASGSMLPSLQVGETAKVDSVKDINELRVGDIVVFFSHTKIAHRLVYIRNFVAITKGDNRICCDGPISVFDIIGIIRKKENKITRNYLKIRNYLRQFRLLRRIRRLISFL